MEKGLTNQLINRVTPIPLHALHLMQRREVDLEQHGDDRDPDQQTDRQIDLRNFHGANRLEQAGKYLPQGDPDQDADCHPCGQIAFKNRWQALRLPCIVLT